LRTEGLIRELRDACKKASSGDKLATSHHFGICNARELDGLNLQVIAERAVVGRSFGTELRKGVRLIEHVRLTPGNSN
jgi:hypothetical protein